MPSSGLLTLYHPALDAGSIPSRHPQPKAKRFGLGIQLVWIPACAGITKKTRGCHPLPSSRTWCGIHSDWIPVLTGMTHPLSSSTESKALRIGDPVLSGFPFSREWRTGIGDPETICLDSRFHGNDGRGTGMTKRRYGNDRRNENVNR